MSFYFRGGYIGIAIESTSGNVHTTTIHIVPIWMVVAILAAIAIPLWIARKHSKDSD